MKYINLLDKTLVETLNRCSSIGDSAGTDLLKAAQHSNTREIIIPILGMQGAGKSTLINALLGENILPEAADETTCVPVEVKYGEKRYAEVFYKNNDSATDIVHSREELEQFVNNNYNQGNEKGVDRIVLYRGLSILKNGLTLVDLPGVGSLTATNEETTKRYIENLCMAIFVLPTVPPIRKMEAFFIKGVWSQFSNAIFVQNHWHTGETATELADSLSYNNIKLSQIANELNNQFNNDIIVVDAYGALIGSLQNDNSLLESSNINALKAKIENVSNNWEKNQYNFIKTRILLTIMSSIQYTNEAIDALNKSRADIISERKSKLDGFKFSTNEMKNKSIEITSLLEREEDNLLTLSQERGKECAKEIRAEMTRIVNSGIYDGPMLSEAFKDIQGDVVPKYFESIIDFFNEVKFKVENLFDDLGEISTENTPKILGVNKNVAVKFEKLIPVVGDLGGAAAGYWLTGIIGGPIGWLTAAAVTLVVGLVGHLTKNGIKSKRASTTLRELEPAFNEIERAFEQESTIAFTKFKNNINHVVEQVLEKRREEEQYLEDHLMDIDDINPSELNSQKAYLENKYKEIENA